MNSLISIKDLLSHLSKEELIFFKQNAIQTNNREQAKSLNVIDLLLSSENFSSNEIQKRIYGRTNYNAFNKLLNRLKNKILESLLNETNLNRNGSYSKKNQLIFKLRKQLIIADILQLKGERKESSKSYRTIIKHAKLNEIYDVEMQAYYGFQRLSINNFSVKKQKLIRKGIEQSEKNWILLNQSQTLFNEMMNKINSSSSNDKYKVELENLIILLEHNIKQTKSSLIEYYFLILMAEKMQNNNEYKKAENYFIRIKHLLENRVSVFTINRYGALLLNLSNNCLFLNDFDESVKYAEESKTYFKALPVTLNIVNEIIYYAFVYKMEYKNAWKAVLSIEANQSDYYFRTHYYKACLHFKEMNFKKVLIELNESTESEKDKEGYNLNIRLLRLISHVELNDLNGLELEFQNFANFLKRTKSKKFIRKRYYIISKIINALLKCNLDFKLVFEKKKKLFQFLELGGKEYVWKIKSPEVINFTMWYKSKVNFI